MIFSYFYLQGFHTAYNITSNERVNQKRYNYLKDGRGAFHNPFNRGFVSNVREFFHMKRALVEKDVEILSLWKVLFNICKKFVPNIFLRLVFVSIVYIHM
jgi:hypothetical protein